MLTQLMDKYKNEFCGFYEEGVADGEARGKAEGMAKGKAEAVLTVLRHRGLPLTEQERARILACKDVALLGRWLEEACLVPRAADLLLEMTG